MTLPPVVRTTEQIEELVRQVRVAALHAREVLNDKGRNPDELAILHTLKFGSSGLHPLEHRPMNLIDQAHLTFATLVTLRAARWLLEHHPGCLGVRLGLGAPGSYDLQSVSPNLFAANAFAATHPQTDSRLANDIKRLATAPGVRHRFVFFHSPTIQAGRCERLEPAHSGVEVWSLDL
jgi:hypothetical protein